MTPLPIFRGARALLAPPEAFTKRALARDLAGVVVDPHNARACSFCLAGAFRRAAGEKRADYYVAYDVFTAIVGRSPIWFADDEQTTHADVLGALDRVIADLEARAA